MLGVVASAFDMVRQRRPTGPAFPVDKDWKDDVRAAMKKQGISQGDLAARIGVTTSALTVLFRPVTKQTRLKPAIHRALGLLAPDASPVIEKDEAFSRLMRVWPHLSEEQRKLLLATSEVFAEKTTRR